MPNVLECFEHAKWLIEKGRGQEAAVLYLPKVEAQRRRENKEKSCRVVFCCTPETKSEFEAQRDRYITLAVNKEVAFSIMCDVLKQVSDELIASLAARGAQ